MTWGGRLTPVRPARKWTRPGRNFAVQISQSFALTPKVTKPIPSYTQLTNLRISTDKIKSRLVFDLNNSPMTRVSSGRYIYPSVNIIDPTYKIGERYYVMFRAVEPVTLRNEIAQEDFTVVDKPGNPGLTYSFIN